MLFVDDVGPITHQSVQTYYQTALTRGIQFVCTAWYVTGQTTSKKKHSMHSIPSGRLKSWVFDDELQSRYREITIKRAIFYILSFLQKIPVL